MAASFAAYASQYINRQPPASSSVSSSSAQPLFFSFVTDEGSRTGNVLHDDDLELDDEGDPHIRHHNSESGRVASNKREYDDDDDPYLRLDEEERISPQESGSSRVLDSIPDPPLVQRRSHEHSNQGWLAHQSPFSLSRSTSSPSDESSNSSEPLSDLHPTVTLDRGPQLPKTRYASDMTESLLPRAVNLHSSNVFSLPDPRNLPRGRRIYNDSVWIVLWCFSLCACFVGFILTLVAVRKPTSVPKGTILPYTTLLHTIPLLTIITLISALVSYLHMLLLKTFVRPIIIATSVFIPASLFISAIWAFVGSFMWEEGVEPTWGETFGLRLFSIIPLFLALYTSRRLLKLPQQIHTTSSVLNIATRVLIMNPLLLALSPLTLLLLLICSIPFMTMAFRLLLIGYPYPISSYPGTIEWHVREWAGWAIGGTLSVWLWSWGVGRGVLKSTTATVVGAWYFHPSHEMPPPPMATYQLHGGLYRATNTSLGTIVLATLLVTGVRLLIMLAALLRRAPVPILPWLSFPLGIIGNMIASLSPYAVIYTGLTGDAFLPSVQRSRALTANKYNVRHRLLYSDDDPSMSLLTITPLTLTLPFALTTYLFVAHSLLAPDYASMAALLAGGVTALVGLFCVGLVSDVVDTLYICYCIDRDAGIKHKEEVFDAFEGITQRGNLSSIVSHDPPPPSNSRRSQTLGKFTSPHPVDAADHQEEGSESDSLILGPDFP